MTVLYKWLDEKKPTQTSQTFWYIYASVAAPNMISLWLSFELFVFGIMNFHLLLYRRCIMSVESWDRS